jgi:hypothetical protein
MGRTAWLPKQRQRAKVAKVIRKQSCLIILFEAIDKIFKTKRPSPRYGDGLAISFKQPGNLFPS